MVTFARTYVHHSRLEALRKGEVGGGCGGGRWEVVVEGGGGEGLWCR